MKETLARHNMVEHQLKTANVFDPQLLALFAQIPREAFLPPALKEVAYTDAPLKLPEGGYLLAGPEQARCLQALNIQPSDRVLEIGTGTGYITAILAALAHALITVDISEDTSATAKTRLTELKLLPSNARVEFKVGDGAQGWTEDGSFDAILLQGSLEILPKAYLTQLNIGGRLFAIIGTAPAMEATLITRLGPQDWRHQVLFETVAPCLINGCSPAQFIF